MDEELRPSQGQRPQHHTDYHRQLPEVIVVGAKKRVVNKPQTSVGDSSNVFTELRDDIPRAEDSTVGDGRQSSESVSPIIDMYEGEERMDTREARVKGDGENDDIQPAGFDQTTENVSPRDVDLSQGQQSQHLTIRGGVAKITDITERHTSTNYTRHTSERMREGEGECALTKKSAARDGHQSIQRFTPVAVLSACDQIKKPCAIGTEEDDMMTVVLDNIAGVPSSRDMDRYKRYHNLKQYSDEHEEVKNESLVLNKESSKTQAVAVDKNTKRNILAPVGDFMDKIVKREVKTSDERCHTSGPNNSSSATFEAVKENKNIACDSSRKTCDCSLDHRLQLHAKTTDKSCQSASGVKREIVGLLREFPSLSPSDSTDVGNAPGKNIRTMFSSFTKGLKYRKKDAGEKATNEILSNDISIPVLRTVEDSWDNERPIEEDHDSHPLIELNNVSDVPRIPKSRGKPNVTSLLKDFPPLPPLMPTTIMNDSSNKNQNKKPRRRMFEFDKVKNFMSSVRTVTSKDSVLTTPSSTKDSNHSGSFVGRTSMSCKKSLTQRFNMRSMGIRGNGGHVSKLQEDRWKQEDLVRDALIRHRALTGVIGVDDTDIERCSQDRLSESDTWKKAFGYLDSDASSLSSHEDVVSVETALSDVTMESRKRSVHTAVVEVMIVIPDVICLRKPKRGFFGKKKLWLNKVR